MAGLRVLLLLPQFPQDPASGAARSMTGIVELLAGRGFDVRVLGVTAGEGAGGRDPLGTLRSLGVVWETRPKSKTRSRPELVFERRGIRYRLIDTERAGFVEWEQRHGRQYDQALDDEIESFDPDIAFGYGGEPHHVRRFERLKRRGVRLVLGLRNHGYHQATPEFFALFDGIVACSQYLAGEYRRTRGIEAAGIPSPIDPRDVVAEEREPIFFTVVNPDRQKGLAVVARVAEELGVRRPDIPFLVIESRGTAGQLVAAGLGAGFDPRRHENLMLAPAVPLPKDIYGPAKALLAPSLWGEPFGRVAAEALLNGVVPLGSDRGGLREICEAGGAVVPVPAEIDENYGQVVGAEVAAPWIDWIERLEDDPALLGRMAAEAQIAGRAYLPETLAPRYRDFFLSVAG